jgi:GDP-D-mannose 3',5'-epimerase
MKILVTGAAGMIGSNLVAKLLELDHNVIGIDNLWRGKIENLEFTCADKISRLKFVIADIDCVIHLADIVAGIGYVFNNEAEIFRKNLLINTAITSAVHIMNVPRYIYVGTACSFPQELQTGVDAPPMKETQQFPAHPESAYGWSKLMGELDANYLSKSSNTKSVVLVLHNVYGTPCEYKGSRSQVLPALVYKALTSKDNQLLIWGTGEQGRAFVHVNDVINALILALDKGENIGPIQIGPNECIKIKDIAEMINNSCGNKLTLTFDTSKPMGDLGRCADYTKAKNILNWKPSVNINEGIIELVQWISEKEL